jgi:hypothetical protein
MGVALDARDFQAGYQEIKRNILPRIDETGISLCRNSLLKIGNQYVPTIRMCSRLRVPLGSCAVSQSAQLLNWEQYIGGKSIYWQLIEP